MRSSFALTSSSHCLVHPPSPPLTLLIFHKERFKASWMSVSPPKIRRTPRKGSVPRIIGFKFSEEPQTNWLFVVHPRSKRFSSRHHRRHVLVSSSWYIAEEEEDEGFFFTWDARSRRCFYRHATKSFTILSESSKNFSSLKPSRLAFLGILLWWLNSFHCNVINRYFLSFYFDHHWGDLSIEFHSFRKRFFCFNRYFNWAILFFVNFSI